MKFIIPSGGKCLSIGKKLVNIASGEFETDCKVTQEALKKAKGVKTLTAEKKKTDKK